MAQGLKGYIVVAEDPSLVSSTHIRQLIATITPVPGLQHLLATAVSYIHVHIAPHRHILIHIIENKGSVVEGAEYGSLCLYSSIWEAETGESL